MEVGLYGKLPSHGDFLRRRLTDDFVNTWDAWLQRSIAASRAALGDRWLDVYLTSPAWRFVCSQGVCGPTSFAGLMMPSVDRVGRYFPMCLAWQPPEDLNPIAVITRCHSWFDASERHVIETLSRDRVDFEAFDERIVALSDALNKACLPLSIKLDSVDAESITNASGAAVRWQLPISQPAELASVLEQLLYHRLRASFDHFVLWWTEGSSLISPSCLVTAGLPACESFVAFLDGSWATSGWRTVRATVTQPHPFADAGLEDDPNTQYRSAGLSDTGLVRQNNQDAFVERPEWGVWAIADGMGGHKDGDIASRMICDALVELPTTNTLDQMVDVVRRKLDEVNTYLWRVSRREESHRQTGSTVVAMLARRSRVAFLWAGDSRAYRLRGERLQRLTRDHTWASEVADGSAILDKTPTGQSDTAITRAVGGAEALDLDLLSDQVCKGDRFLLCSDGLTREIDDAKLGSILKEGDAVECARQLLQAALAAGAHDNVSVIVIDAD